jgi:subtilisin family serine protease
VSAGIVCLLAVSSASGASSAQAWPHGTTTVGYSSEVDLAAALRRHPGTVLQRIKPLHVATIRPLGSVPAFAAALSREPGIRYVERAAPRQSAAEPALGVPLARTAAFEWQYAATRVDSVPDWVRRAAGSVTIAVIDTGADLSAPDLAAKSPGAYNVLNTSDDVRDANGHGTFVASLAAGSGDNGEGMAGSGGDARLLVVKAGRTDGTFSDVDEASAIVYAVQHGARVINLSVGGPSTSTTERRAVEYAIARGALLVAAVGNEFEAGNPVEYPAALLQPVGSNGVGGLGLSVGASAADGHRATFSNTGSHVSLLAPGVTVFGAVSALSSPLLYPRTPLSGSRDGLYGFASGTSFAAPQVAGAAALVWAANPTLAATDVAAILKQTASGLGSWSSDLGYGVVDVASAVARARGGSSVLLSGVRVGERVHLTWSGTSAAKYRLQLARDDGESRVLLSATDQTNAWVRLVNGHTYAFTVTALDGTGSETSISAPLTVRAVKVRASLSLAASTVSGHHPLHQPNQAAIPAGARSVGLEFFRDNRWHPAGQLTTTAAGKATWTVSLGPGRYRIRAAFSGGDDLGGVTSPVVALQVR